MGYDRGQYLAPIGRTARLPAHQPTESLGGTLNRFDVHMSVGDEAYRLNKLMRSTDRNAAVHHGHIPSSAHMLNEPNACHYNAYRHQVQPLKYSVHAKHAPGYSVSQVRIANYKMVESTNSRVPASQTGDLLASRMPANHTKLPLRAMPCSQQPILDLGGFRQKSAVSGNGALSWPHAPVRNQFMGSNPYKACDSQRSSQATVSAFSSNYPGHTYSSAANIVGSYCVPEANLLSQQGLTKPYLHQSTRSTAFANPGYVTTRYTDKKKTGSVRSDSWSTSFAGDEDFLCSIHVNAPKPHSPAVPGNFDISDTVKSCTTRACTPSLNTLSPSSTMASIPLLVSSSKAFTSGFAGNQEMQDSVLSVVGTDRVGQGSFEALEAERSNSVQTNDTYFTEAVSVDTYETVVQSILADDEKSIELICAGGLEMTPEVYSIFVCPSIFTDSSSLAALEYANMQMSKMKCPGGVAYVPVSEDSFIFHAGTQWEFTAYNVALGASYFGRLLIALPALQAAVRANPRYEQYVIHLPQNVQGACKVAPADHSQDSTLQSIQFTCIYLATKTTDRVPHVGMLRWMLSHLYGSMVSHEQACEVESKCLLGLQWRLGPFFDRDAFEDGPFSEESVQDFV